MRICPKCGFVDPPEWKNLHFQLYHEYMIFDDFQRLYPQLAARLKQNPKIIFDDKKQNAYHLTKAGYVHRVPAYLITDEKKWFHASSLYEKPKDPFQKKLADKKGRVHVYPTTEEQPK